MPPADDRLVVMEGWTNHLMRWSTVSIVPRPDV